MKKTLFLKVLILFLYYLTVLGTTYISKYFSIVTTILQYIYIKKQVITAQFLLSSGNKLVIVSGRNQVIVYINT